MSSYVMIPLAVLLPWVAFLIMGEFAAAIVALVFQATIIGWIPASIWAIKTYYRDHKPKTEPPTKK